MSNVMKSELSMQNTREVDLVGPIISKDGMSKLHCSSQRSLHTIDVPASSALLCSCPDLKLLIREVTMENESSLTRSIASMKLL